MQIIFQFPISDFFFFLFFYLLFFNVISGFKYLNLYRHSFRATLTEQYNCSDSTT